MDELDKQFIVSDVIDKTSLHKAIENMTTPQRFKVEKAMNEIFAQESDDEQNAFVERCLQTPTIHWNFRIETGKGYSYDHWFPNIETMAKGVYKWLHSHNKISIVCNKNALQFIPMDEKQHPVSQHEFVQFWQNRAVSKWETPNCDWSRYKLSYGGIYCIYIAMFHAEKPITFSSQ